MFFSSDLKQFKELPKTYADHWLGAIEILNGELIAIAGHNTRTVELMRNRQWKVLEPVGNKNGRLYLFSSLIVPGNTSDILFIFGIYILIFSLFIVSIRWRRWRKIGEKGLAIQKPTVEKLLLYQKQFFILSSPHCTNQ